MGISGYIGDESDVERLEKSFEQDFRALSRELKAIPYKRCLSHGCNGCTRVKGTDKLANKLRTPEYWKKAPFRWFEKRQPQRPSHEYESIIRMMIGYSLCMDPDLDKKCAAIVQGIEDPNEKEIMQKALNPKANAITRKSYNMLKKTNLLQMSNGNVFLPTSMVIWRIEDRQISSD